jgi:hypothetical protein
MALVMDIARIKIFTSPAILAAGTFTVINNVRSIIQAALKTHIELICYFSVIIFLLLDNTEFPKIAFLKNITMEFQWLHNKGVI